MDVECLILAGEWRVIDGGAWDFDIDKKKMCRVVHLSESNTVREVSEKVLVAYSDVCNANRVSLSYMSPVLEALGIGKRTPPVVCSTDDSMKTCYRLLVKKDILFLYGCLVEDGSKDNFVTPIVGQKRKIANYVGGSSNIATSSISQGPQPTQETLEVCMKDKKFMADLKAIEDKMRSSVKKPVESSVSKHVEATSSQAVGQSASYFVEQRLPKPVEPIIYPIKPHVEASVSKRVEVTARQPVEATAGQCSRNYVEPRGGRRVEPRVSVQQTARKHDESVEQTARVLCLEDDDDSDSEDPLEADEIDVSSRGYDKEFWEPLLDESFGGSNAVEIMLEPDDDIPLTSQSVVSEDTNHNPPTGFLSNNFSFGQASRVEQSTTEDGGDIPSMFDDTQYQTAVIPDLDLDDGEIIIAVGKVFVSKVECQIALAIYAIRNMFHFLQRRTTKKNFVVSCADVKCSWFVNARVMKDSLYYRINKANLEHICSIETRCKYPKLATARVIAHVFKSKYAVADTGPKPKNLQQLVLEDLRVSTTYSKCWRANQSANEEVRGTEEDAYLKVEAYLHMLKVANPGSITEVKTVVGEGGVVKFLYLFLAFGASIAGFKMLRPVIVLDGTHLSGKYKGVLLTASGQDANFQVFPLAFAVVDAENDKSWEWFLTKLKELTTDTASLTIISDRHQSIAKGVKSVFKKAKHGVCIVHLARNVVTKFKNKGLANLVMNAASAYKIKKFDDVFGKIKAKSARCAKWLDEIGYQSWSRVHFPGNRYNLMTSNIAESLNNALNSARRGTILELLMFIQSMLMKWFSVRREKSVCHTGFITPEVDKIISRNLKLAKGSKVTSSTAWSTEVVGVLGGRTFVELSEKRCTCKIYDHLKIPCGHALLAAGAKNYPYERLVGEHYKSSAWEQTYAGVIKPTEEADDHNIPTHIASRIIHPPNTKRPCGRPRVTRLPSAGEIRDPKNQRKCGRCGKVGHNKTSCKNAI